MTALRKPTRITFDEYLMLEETSTVRHELINGTLFAMSGGSDAHHLVCTNLVLLLAGPLKGKCQTFMGGMKLRVAHQSDSDGYYPDLMVSCAASDREKFYRREPLLLIEVLSPSTERFDRGEKRLNYMQIPSLQEYVMVAQDKPHVEIMRRSDAWATEDLFRTDSLHLASVGLSIPISAIYDTITF